ncbi:Catenin-beta-like protein [Mycena floridula]|nr:Catenin-beta-like protein [Mycena floridula]
MDIDKLFKVPKLPAGGNKRKLPDNPTPEVLKKLKFDTESTPVPSASTSTTVTMEEVEDEDTPSSFAPGNDADYFAEEDDEGRFFGGGLTSEQKDILNIFDNAAEDTLDEYEELSISGIRRLLVRFERAVNKNQEQRSKYSNNPSKFIDSEADLDSAIKALLPLAQAPALAYTEIVRSGTIGLLVGLLSHENADIVIDVVEVVHELTDEDVGNEGETGDEEENTEALKILIKGLLEHSILELLVDNLTRLNEEEESDRQGVFHILGIFENVLGFNPELSTTLVSKTKVFSWLLNRIQSKTHDDNRGYAAELISILLQNHRENRLELAKLNGVETFLTVLSQYRRRDPQEGEETEFMENVFDSLCSALSETSVKKLFVEAEGIDLMLIMMKERAQARSRAIKTLDFAMSGSAASFVSEAFIEALGLKTLFTALMGKSKKQKTTATPASEDTSHILGILSSFFSNIASDSPERIRLLAKFVENSYEKVDKLLDIRETARSRLALADAEIAEERKAMAADGEEVTSDEEDLWYLRRLDNGLFLLQTVDYILAWIAMDDDGIRGHLLQMLDRKNQSLQDIVKTLHLYHDSVDEETSPEAEDGPGKKDILQGLISALGDAQMQIDQ